MDPTPPVKPQNVKTEPAATLSSASSSDSQSTSSPSTTTTSPSSSSFPSSLPSTGNVKPKPISATSVLSTCQTCGKTFCSVGALKRHNLAIHFKNEIFPCTVEGCGRSFLLKEYLKKHLTRYHKLPPQFPRKKKAKNGEAMRELMASNSNDDWSSSLLNAEAKVEGLPAAVAKAEKPSGEDDEKLNTSPESGNRSSGILASLLTSPINVSKDHSSASAVLDASFNASFDSASSKLADGGDKKPEADPATATAKRVRKKRNSSASPTKKTVRVGNEEEAKSPTAGAGVGARAVATAHPTSAGKSNESLNKQTLTSGDGQEGGIGNAGGNAISAVGNAVAGNVGAGGAGAGVEAGKGKRRKQKKALVEGWVDPDELAEDFWKSPEKAAHGIAPAPAPLMNSAAPVANAATSVTATNSASAFKRTPSSSTFSKKEEHADDEDDDDDADFKPTNFETPKNNSNNKDAPKKASSGMRKKKIVKKKKSKTPDLKLLELESENRQFMSLIRSRETHYQHHQQQHHHHYPSLTPPPGSSTQSHKGPVIRVTGRNLASPSSAVVINHPDQLSGLAGLGTKGSVGGSGALMSSSFKAAGRSYAGPFINEKIAKGLYNRPPTHFLLNYEDTHNWRCMLCGHGNFFDDLGQLFGPFHLAEAKLTNPIFGRKSTVSLCRESFSTSESLADADASGSVFNAASASNGSCAGAAPTASPMPQLRSRVVSGTKGSITGSRSPTRSAITSSGNIAASQPRGSSDSMTVVTNPEPEPFEVWLHESCVVWSVGVYMVQGKIYGLEEALNLAAETKCSHCLENGATLGCFKSCNSNFHYHCAKKNNCQFNEQNFTIRCPKHADATSVRITDSEKIINNVSVMVH